MILFLPKLFDELRCVQLNQIALNYSAKQALNFEGNDPHYGNSFGFVGYWNSELKTMPLSGLTDPCRNRNAIALYLQPV